MLTKLTDGEGKWHPTPVFLLENPRDRGAWWAAVHGVAQSQTPLKRLSSSSSKLTEGDKKMYVLKCYIKTSHIGSFISVRNTHIHTLKRRWKLQVFPEFFKMHFHKVSSLEWIYSLKIEDNLPNRNGQISHTFKETDIYKIIAKDF